MRQDHQIPTALCVSRDGMSYLWPAISAVGMEHFPDDLAISAPIPRSTRAQNSTFKAQAKSSDERNSYTSKLITSETALINIPINTIISANLIHM